MAVYFISETALAGDVSRAVEAGLFLTIINVQTPPDSFLLGRNPDNNFNVWQLALADNRVLLGTYTDWTVAVADARAAQNKFDLFRRGSSNA